MKIALLAMSGVRAHDKKLMEYGLTLPGASGTACGTATAASWDGRVRPCIRRPVGSDGPATS